MEAGTLTRVARVTPGSWYVSGGVDLREHPRSGVIEGGPGAAEDLGDGLVAVPVAHEGGDSLFEPSPRVGGDGHGEPVADGGGGALGGPGEPATGKEHGQDDGDNGEGYGDEEDGVERLGVAVQERGEHPGRQVVADCRVLGGGHVDAFGEMGAQLRGEDGAEQGGADGAAQAAREGHPSGGRTPDAGGRCGRCELRDICGRGGSRARLSREAAIRWARTPPAPTSPHPPFSQLDRGPSLSAVHCSSGDAPLIRYPQRRPHGLRRR